MLNKNQRIKFYQMKIKKIMKIKLMIKIKLIKIKGKN